MHQFLYSRLQCRYCLETDPHLKAYLFLLDPANVRSTLIIQMLCPGNTRVEQSAPRVPVLLSLLIGENFPRRPSLSAFVFALCSYLLFLFVCFRSYRPYKLSRLLRSIGWLSPSSASMSRKSHGAATALVGVRLGGRRRREDAPAVRRFIMSPSAAAESRHTCALTRSAHSFRFVGLSVFRFAVHRIVSFGFFLRVSRHLSTTILTNDYD